MKLIKQNKCFINTEIGSVDWVKMINIFMLCQNIFCDKIFCAFIDYNFVIVKVS